jgi:copper(I)-binding protein
VLRSSSGLRHSRRYLIAVTAALIPLIAGCEAGAGAPTLHWHQPTDGTGATVGNITISNAFVLGAPIGAAIAKGRNAGLFLGLTNIGHASDRLVSVSAPGTARAVSLPGSEVQLASERAVLLAGPRPQLILENLLHPITGGSVVSIVLRFAKAGVVHLQVPVMPRAQYFATLRPAPAPTPTTTVTPSTPIAPTPTPTASSSP